jgi:hypothetical protein
MLWCLAVVLLMPWFDNGRSYREMARSLEIAAMGERETHPGACIAAARLPGHVRSSLDYFAGLRTERIIDGTTPCPLLLVMNDDPLPARLAPEWQTVWEFQRGAGRRAERFALLRRELPEAPFPPSHP